jgi:hypothetical protein
MPVIRIVGNGDELNQKRLAAMERVATLSELPVTIAPGAGGGEPTTLHGWFQPAYPDDPVDSARAFIEKAREVADLEDIEEVLGSAPVRSFRSDGTSTISFPFESEGMRYFGCGAAVTMDAGGRIRSVGVHLPAERVEAPTDPDPGPATEFVRGVIDESEVEQEIPAPRLEVFDPAAVFGDPQPPRSSGCSDSQVTGRLTSSYHWTGAGRSPRSKRTPLLRRTPRMSPLAITLTRRPGCRTLLCSNQPDCCYLRQAAAARPTWRSRSLRSTRRCSAPGTSRHSFRCVTSSSTPFRVR